MPKLLPKILLFIAVITIITGFLQVVAAPLVLKFIGAETDKASSHFFAIIGMFMILFGGMLWQSLRQPQSGAVPVFWCGMQKLGAAGAIGLGVIYGIFDSLALAVALFDFLSGVLIFIYWRKLKYST